MASCFSPNFIISNQAKMDTFLLGKKIVRVFLIKKKILSYSIFPNRLAFMMDLISKLMTLKEKQRDIRISK